MGCNLAAAFALVCSFEPLRGIRFSIFNLCLAHELICLPRTLASLSEDRENEEAFAASSKSTDLRQYDSMNELMQDGLKFVKLQAAGSLSLRPVHMGETEGPDAKEWLLQILQYFLYQLTGSTSESPDAVCSLSSPPCIP